jgi:tRNA A-37 threonylcarbamoyl transferase component Bud32
MHTHGLVHGDVKTANFCTAVKDGVNKENHARTPSAVYIMDMGFAEDFTRLSGEGHACRAHVVAAACFLQAQLLLHSLHGRFSIKIVLPSEHACGTMQQCG